MIFQHNLGIVCLTCIFCCLTAFSCVFTKCAIYLPLVLVQAYFPCKVCKTVTVCYYCRMYSGSTVVCAVEVHSQVYMAKGKSDTKWLLVWFPALAWCNLTEYRYESIWVLHNWWQKRSIFIFAYHKKSAMSV